nr:transposase (putative), gypsy type [Tanacetum cinerariifolium]
MPAENTYSPEAVRILDTHRTPIQKQPEVLLCLVGLSRRYYLGDEVYPTFLHNDDQDIDLFNLIRAPNPTKVKTGSRPRAAHEVPLLTVTANRVIEIEDPAAATDSSGKTRTAAPEVPPPEDVPTMRGALEVGPAERATTTDPHAVKERRKRGNDGIDTNAPPKLLRRDHADPRPTESTRGRKSLDAIEMGMGSTRSIHASQGAPADVSDSDPLSFADPQSRPSADGAAAAGDPESENTSFASMVGSPEGIYRPEWGIKNGSMLDTPKACQDLVDYVAPPRYFLELRHLRNDDFLKQYNVNLAWQVAMGSQLRLRFEQEVKLLKKSVGQVARRDKRIQAGENKIKNLETLLEAEADMKKAAEDKSAEFCQELENMRALFSDLQVSNNCLSQQVSTLQEQVSGEEKLKVAFEEFKQYEDNRVEQRCAEIDARLDALSIDFDEELYPHMLTAIAGHRWMIGRGMRLAVMKCGESIELRQAFADANLDLEAIEAYDPKAEAKYIAALQALKKLKYPLVDQLEGLKDAPMDVIMASLHLESDTGDDAPQWVRKLHPSSSQLMIHVYPKVRDPMDPWACKEEMLLANAIAANVSRAEKKKKCRVVCRTHKVGSAHHARSDGVPVSVSTIVPQGLAILLGDAATQTETSDEASPQFLRSSSLPVIHS